MEEIRKTIPGALFLLVFFATLLFCSPAIWLLISDNWPKINAAIKDQQWAVLGTISLTAIISFIALSTFIINQIWQFIFFCLMKGYNCDEYKPVRDKLLASIPEKKQISGERSLQRLFRLYMDKFFTLTLNSHMYNGCQEDGLLIITGDLV